jgi:feruloyl-CoA hydratase/lyase
MTTAGNTFATLHVEFADGIAWVRLNRPEKRNAMNPAMNAEMLALLDSLEVDERCRVMVLTGAGEVFSAGMDIKEYFRETDDLPVVARHRIFRTAADWQWRRLRALPKPTIAMVNGGCFGGAFTPVIACDIAIAAEEARFGLSEINWGIIPAGNVAKALQTVMPDRAALYHIMTGETFDGRQAAAFGVVTEAVPLAQLRERVRRVALTLMEKDPTILWQAKIAWRNLCAMDWETADDYLRAKQEQGQFRDGGRSRSKGMHGFIERRSFRPGLGSDPDGKSE